MMTTTVLAWGDTADNDRRVKLWLSSHGAYDEDDVDKR